jgi:hypothetical protein
VGRRREEPQAALPRRGKGWGPARHRNCFVEAEDAAAGACGVGVASVLLLPCWHLCLCKSCEPRAPNSLRAPRLAGRQRSSTHAAPWLTRHGVEPHGGGAREALRRAPAGPRLPGASIWISKEEEVARRGLRACGQGSRQRGGAREQREQRDWRPEGQPTAGAGKGDVRDRLRVGGASDLLQVWGAKGHPENLETSLRDTAAEVFSSNNL